MALTSLHRRATVMRPIATILALCCVALGIVMSPLATGTSQAVSYSDDSQDVLMVSNLTYRKVDVENGSSDDGTTIVTNDGLSGREPPTQHWQFNVDSTDSTFTIVNKSTGKCIDAANNKQSRLTQNTCNGQSTQKWYLTLVAGTGNVFYIRSNVDSKCMDLLNGSDHDGAWVGIWDCSGKSNQQFELQMPWGASTSFQTLAVQHEAAADCQDPTNGKCSWKVLSEETATVGLEQCVSTVWNNTRGTKDMTASYSRQVTTGRSDALGFSVMLGASFKWGASLFGLVTGEATVSTSLTTSYTHTWTSSDSTTNATTLSVPPGEYGWVTVGQLGKKVTGQWTFDKGKPTEWTYTATLVIPAADGTDSMQSATTPHYSATPPTDCPSAT